MPYKHWEWCNTTNQIQIRRKQHNSRSWKNEQIGPQFMFVKIMGPFKTIMHIDDHIGILPFQDLNLL